MCGALARGKSSIVNPLGSYDTSAATGVLRKLGTVIKWGKGAWTVTGNPFCAPAGDLFCGDSAATLRTMMALCSLVPGRCVLTAGESLSRRPQQPLIDALVKLGVKCSAEDGLPPVVVEGGKLKGGVTSLPGDISSQYVSALLLAAPLAEKDVVIRLTTPLESRPYVLMTLDTMQWFGVTVTFSESLDEFTVIPRPYNPTRYTVEGDWSSASYLLAGGALAGDVTVSGLTAETMQGDRMMVAHLEAMGARIKQGHGAANCALSGLKPLKADFTDCIDLLPTAAVLAAVADGTSRFAGIARARIKESDRVAAVREGLARLGVRTTERRDLLTVTGGRIAGAEVDSKNDHRIAMAFSLLGLVTGDMVIDGAECVAKTYPEFWDVLRGLGANVTLQ
jgi:3-phosphoshikimate 1-carboxyvinyltransferase